MSEGVSHSVIPSQPSPTNLYDKGGANRLIRLVAYENINCCTHPCQKGLRAQKLSVWACLNSPKLLTSDFLLHLGNWFCFALFYTWAYFIEVWHTHGIQTTFGMMRSMMWRLYMRRFGDTSQPFVINDHIQIGKIAKSVSAVEILKATLRRVHFFVPCNEKTPIPIVGLWKVFSTQLLIELSLLNPTIVSAKLYLAVCARREVTEDAIFLIRWPPAAELTKPV